MSVSSPHPTADSRPDALSIEQRDRFVIARFASPCMTLSWAIVHGGYQRSLGVVWHEVRNDELAPPTDAEALLRMRMQAFAMHDMVGLLTSRRVSSFAVSECEQQGLKVTCIATVGLGNALRAGDPPGPDGRIGTINLLCHATEPLTHEAALEALALSTEARALAVREASVTSARSGEPASGTGTDCSVVASPVKGDAHRYSGKHTALGYLIGRACFEAVSVGIERWRAEQSAQFLR